MKAEEPVPTVIGNFQIGAQLPNSRTLTVSVYITDADKAEDLDKRLDLFQERIERQRTRCEIPELEAKREQLIGHLKGVKKMLGDLADKKQKGQSLSSQERLNLQNAEQNIKHMEEEIKKGEEAIAVAKRKAGVA